MKYGNFVKKEDVAFTEKEIKEFKNLISNNVKKYQPNAKLNFEMVEKTKHPYSQRHYVCTMRLPNTYIGRDVYKNRFFTNGITFSLYKESGYLEEQHLPNYLRENYKDAPEFQFSVYIHYDGAMIEKGKKIYCSLCGVTLRNNKHTFDYDTEINGLQEIECGINDYFKTLIVKTAKPTKEQDREKLIKMLEKIR